MYFLYFSLTLWLAFIFFTCGLDALEWKLRGGRDREWYKNCGYRRGIQGGKDEPDPSQLPDNRRKAIRALTWWFEGYRQGVLDQAGTGTERWCKKDDLGWRSRGGLTEEEYMFLEDVNGRTDRPCPISRHEWDKVKSTICADP